MGLDWRSVSELTLDALARFYKERALYYGDYTLASGLKSHYYIDSKQVIMNGDAAWKIGKLIWRIIEDHAYADISAVGGLEQGAIPIATAVVVQASFEAVDLEGFYVRKKPKDHGSAELIAGRVRPGDNVLIVEDVATTGSSALQAIRAVEDVGAKVNMVVSVVDRLQGAAEVLHNYNYLSLLTVEDLGVNNE